MIKTLLFLLCASVASITHVIGETTDPARLSGRTDLEAPKDCLPAAMKVYDALPGPPTCTWKRLLSARFSDGRPNHVYCVFSLGSQIYAYDNVWGSRKVFPSDRSALSVARALNFQADTGVYLDAEDSLTAATQTLTRTKPAKPQKSIRARSKLKATKNKPDSRRALQDVL